uniref:Uncharacterized protein n=1 Tax=Vespula pensylvanica TaxID=30213 RepID=A0A834K3S7_VESPE|nr:hypothetical protein H0235_015616 [Vespula pensylvanica]
MSQRENQNDLGGVRSCRKIHLFEEILVETVEAIEERSRSKTLKSCLEALENPAIEVAGLLPFLPTTSTLFLSGKQQGDGKGGSSSSGDAAGGGGDGSGGGGGGGDGGGGGGCHDPPLPAGG